MLLQDGKCFPSSQSAYVFAAENSKYELTLSWGLNSVKPPWATIHIKCLNREWTKVSWNIPVLIRELNNWDVSLHHILYMLVCLLYCWKYFSLQQMPKYRHLSHYQPAPSSTQLLSTTCKLTAHSNSLWHLYTLCILSGLNFSIPHFMFHWDVTNRKHSLNCWGSYVMQHLKNSMWKWYIWPKTGSSSTLLETQ